MCTFYVCVCVRLNSVHIAEVGMFVRTPDDDDDEREGPRTPKIVNGQVDDVLLLLVVELLRR